MALVSLPATLPGKGVPLVYLFTDDVGRAKIGLTRNLAFRAQDVYRHMTCLAYWQTEHERRAERVMIDHFLTRFRPFAFCPSRRAPPEWFIAGELEAYQHFAARIYDLSNRPLDTSPRVAKAELVRHARRNRLHHA